MADLNKLIKFLQLWQEVEEKSTSVSPEVASESPANGPAISKTHLSSSSTLEQELRLALTRGNMYARFIRLSEQYINYSNGSDKEYEIIRTCVYGQLREDKKNGLL